jgi:N-methylhydantoinase B
VNCIAGGGGCGPPLHRAPAAVVADVLDGYVYQIAAERIYGKVMHSDGTWQPTPERVAATKARRPDPHPVPEKEET